VPFYLDAARHLKREGLLAVNLLTRRKSAAPAIGRMREAFDDRVLELTPSEAGNVVAICAVGPPVSHSIEELRLAAARLKAESGLDLRPTVARLAVRGRRVDL